MRLENRSEDKIGIRQASSLLLDIPYGDFTLYSYDGAWARERHETAHELKSGITVIDSKLGISGNEQTASSAFQEMNITRWSSLKTTEGKHTASI